MITYALTTKDRVKARLEITPTALDDVIETFIASATAFIEHACGNRRFMETAYTNELYDGSDLCNNPDPKQFLILNNAPLASITKIEYRAGTRTNPTWIEILADNYEPHPNGIIKVTLPAGIQNIRVTYTAGYKIDFTAQYDASKHTLPYDVTNLCERMVVKMIQRRKSEGKTQEALRESSINWGGLLDAEDKDVINNFKRTAIM